MQNKVEPLPVLARLTRVTRLVSSAAATVIWTMLAPYDLAWARALAPVLGVYLLKWAVMSLLLDGLASVVDDLVARLRRLTAKRTTP